MTRQSKMEIRVWERSPVRGMSIGEIRERFNVFILKVSRGNEARNPPDKMRLDGGDYIFLVGESQNCSKFVEYSKVPIL